MKTLIVNKYSAVFRTRKAGTTVAGEQGETEGTLRHLIDLAAERGDFAVAYYGHTQGEELCPYYEPEMNGVNELSTWEEQERELKRECQELEELIDEPFGVLQISGQTPTRVFNGKCRMMGYAVRYSAPILYACQHFRLPRWMVLNDPRCYPRDQEMSEGYDWIRPRAILGQSNERFERVVGGKEYIVRCVQAHAESWSWFDPILDYASHVKDWDAVCIAHAHIEDGIKSRGRDRPWREVLSYGTIPTFGRGWDCDTVKRTIPQLDWRGTLDAGRVWEFLARSWVCPIVSHTPGFYTGKPYVVFNNGCFPVFYGDGSDQWTYDIEQVHVPFCEVGRYRFTDYESLRSCIAWAKEHPSECEAFWRMTLTPKWQVLDAFIDAALRGECRQESKQWGGYRAIN